jgi:hypothetical protein
MGPRLWTEVAAELKRMDQPIEEAPFCSERFSARYSEPSTRCDFGGLDEQKVALAFQEHTASAGTYQVSEAASRSR